MEEDFRAFEHTLVEMGINPHNLGQNDGSNLPPLPPSDPSSLQRNHYDGFYKYGARDYWQEAQLSQNKVEEYKKCAHYLMRQNDEVICRICHAGWIVPNSFHVQNGKLYDGEQLLQFAV